MQYITNSEKETKELAKKIAQNRKNNIIALTGPLGAGKTIFVQGFAQGLGIKDKIISPTFVLVRQHGNLPAGRQVFYHVDLYRVDDFKDLGLEEILSNKNNIVLIEWAEKLKTLPKGTIKISIQIQGPCTRIFKILS